MLVVKSLAAKLREKQLARNSKMYHNIIGRTKTEKIANDLPIRQLSGNVENIKTAQKTQADALKTLSLTAFVW